MKNYFHGYYFKCQSPHHTLALIPALHQTKHEKSCSIQIILDDTSWSIPCSLDSFKMAKHGLPITMGNHFFSRDKISLDLHTESFHAHGTLCFSQLSPLRYDIMGPFHLVPNMECYHEIISMHHLVDGDLYINEECYHFEHDLGYIEGDRGYSFPEKYIWTHCFFNEGSIMVSIAKIPIGPIHFTGIICAIDYLGKEYRLATYLGAKVVQLLPGYLHIQQGKDELIITFPSHTGTPLLAPSHGQMARTIRENIQCPASYCFKRKKHVLFDVKTEHASFEYEYDF